MQRILIAVFGLLMLQGVIAAQTVSCYSEVETCPDKFPPDADVVVGGRPASFYSNEIFKRSADWYFYDDASKTWFAFDDAEILPFADGAFDEAFDQLGWEALLKDPDTEIEVRSDGNTIALMDEKNLHLIDLSASLVLSIPFREYGAFCTAPDGGRLDWYEDEGAWRELSQEGGTRIVRCKYGFSFSHEFARLRTIYDPESIRSGVLRILGLGSPCCDEKIRFGIEHQLNPPEIWFYHSTDYGPRFEIFLKLDGTYGDDLETGTIGPRKFGFMDLHDRLVQWDIAGQRILRDLGGISRKRRARSTLVNLLERVLTVTPATWLLWVETDDDNILIRNLSTIYTKEANE
ncbi:MAG: hypothetical protein OXG60_08345 [Chloroflexi bacterium]|nr:hypothetical protein [Chloroflexota bacterium]